VQYAQQLPTCYFVSPPALKTGHLSKFTLEILFYIFYGMPKDALQAYAAQELHNREWRYHVEHQLWFKRAVPGDGIDLGDGSPKYIYFDYRSWDRRHFTGSIQDLAQGFLSEDDVRVRIGNSS
jgi:CCR4-NOT transcription complex subunit 2